MNFFAYLFSPFGSVGRGGWWFGQLFFFGGLFALIIFAGATLRQADKKLGLDPSSHFPTTTKLTSAQNAAILDRIKAEFSVAQSQFYTIGALFLLLLWMSLAIEIKRWHDLGMSGFMALNRLSPVLVHFLPPLIGGLLSFGLGIVLLVYLGFRSGGYGYESPSQSSRPASQSSQGGGSFGLILILLLVVVGGGFWAVKSGMISQSDIKKWTPAALQSRSGDTASAPIQSVPDNYHGTADTQFAKDWVKVGGEKLTGISSVLPARGGKVLIVYSDGGKSAAVSALPQGFLDLWSITPERMQDLDK